MNVGNFQKQLCFRFVAVIKSTVVIRSEINRMNCDTYLKYGQSEWLIQITIGLYNHLSMLSIKSNP